MDFTNRGGQPAAAPAQTAARGSKKGLGKGMKILSGALLISVAMLLIAVVVFLGFVDNSEARYVQKERFQAVFLNGGQVYFGKVRNLNEQYITMDNIYYLRVNSTGSTDTAAANSQDVSLAKLGCELHGPEDKMVINREQVTFWENLKTDGQVAKAISEYVKQNPNGQQCSTENSTTQGSSTTPAATTTTPAATTPAATTKKP